MFASKITDEEQKELAVELEKKIDPFDSDAIKRVASAVILEAAKTWKRGCSNTIAKKFFLGEDYLFWSMMAGINIEGQAIIDSLERNGGVFSKRLED